MTLRSARRSIDGPAVRLGALWLAGCLSACSPVAAPLAAYRSLVGFDKNDPDPAVTSFNANLARAEAEPFANLASVPPPPVVATSLAERQKLAATLTGNRTSLQASDTHGPGTPAPGPVPPPPAVPPSIAAPEVAALPTAPPPPTPIPPMRPMDEPPLPASPESTMRTPQIGNLPGVEPSRPAPTQGQPSAIPPPASENPTPAMIASANPLPAPPRATLPEPKPSPEAAARPPPKLPPKTTTVASLDVPPGAAAVGPDDYARLAPAVVQFQQQPRPIRVVAYAAPGVGSAEELNAFRAALDRAQMVAKELIAAGIPANKIQTEAAPASPTAPPGRVEVQLLQ